MHSILPRFLGMTRSFEQNERGSHCVARVGVASPHRRAFTLVEILIVVVIIAILAAIAVPKLSSAAQLSRENSVKADLQYMRTEIAVYESQHGDVFPGGGSSGANTLFAQQMTGYTDASGDVQPQGQPVPPYNFGPYLTNIPINPLTGFKTVEILPANASPQPDNNYGWIYQPSTGIILPDDTGSDQAGVPYTKY